MENKDHCTASFDGWWSQACKLHDADYARIKGMRASSDENFYLNLQASNMPKVISYIYYKSVRLFGRLFV